MGQEKISIISIIWKTPLLRRIVLIVAVASVLVPSYDLLAVYPSFSRKLIVSFEKEATRTSNHLLHLLAGDLRNNNSGFSKESFSQEDAEYLNLAKVDFGLWKARLFSPEGEIVLSTKSEEIGRFNNNDYFFDIVAKGRTFSKIENKQHTTMEGEILPLDVIEIYVPIMHEGYFYGALEIYYDITKEREELYSLFFKAGATLLALIVIIDIAISFLLVRTVIGSRKLQEVQHDLDTQERIFQDVINSARDGIIVTDADQHIKIMNPAFIEQTGYEKDELLHHRPALLKSGHHDTYFYRQMWQSIRDHQHWRGEIWNRRKDGSVFPELLSISTIRETSDEVSHYVGIYTDISQQKASEQYYQKMAYHDHLTKLPNRLLFLDRLEQALRESVRGAEQIALLFLDLDGFKEVNDSAGHDAGDFVLRTVADRLLRSVRKGDTVSRIGGDEFTLVMRKVDVCEVLPKIGNKLINIINEPIAWKNKTLHVGASIGIACYPLDAEEAKLLIEAADEAMYEAKQRGKNQLVMRCNATD